VIDLTARPPQVIQRLTAGDGATDVRISPDGALALVANRLPAVSVFVIYGKRLEAAARLDLGHPKAGAKRHRLHRRRQECAVDADGDSMISCCISRDEDKRSTRDR